MYAIVLQRDNLSLITYRAQKNVRLLGHIALMQRKEETVLRQPGTNLRIAESPPYMARLRIAASSLSSIIRGTG